MRHLEGGAPFVHNIGNQYLISVDLPYAIIKDI